MEAAARRRMRRTERMLFLFIGNSFASGLQEP
jgi:hypothetical protein